MADFDRTAAETALALFRAAPDTETVGAHREVSEQFAALLALRFSASVAEEEDCLHCAILKLVRDRTHALEGIDPNVAAEGMALICSRITKAFGEVLAAACADGKEKDILHTTFKGVATSFFQAREVLDTRRSKSILKRLLGQ